MTSLADGDWHRLHPASPLLRGGIFVFALLGFVIANLRERLVDLVFGIPRESGDPLDEIYERGAVGWALLVAAVILVVILIAFTLSWRMHTFRVTDESVEVRSGILFRSHRQARLDRIQGVNIVRPLIPRLFGAAKLEVSVAGQDANVQLAYLGSALADGLRRDILHLASGARQSGSAAPSLPVIDDTVDSGVDAAAAPPYGPGQPGPAPRPGLGDYATARVGEFLAPELDPDAAPPQSVVRIPPLRLIGSIVFSGYTVFVALLAVALIASVVAGGSEWLLIAIFPGAIASVGFYFSRFTKSLRYSIAGTPDGVRVGFGLLTTSNETLPPGRIHAIGVSQPLAWRPFGWWQIRINKAGHSTNDGAAGQAATTMLPVGSLADVAKVLELILPGFEAEEQRALIERGLTSRGGDDGFRSAPRRAAWLRPFSWRRTGYAVSAGVALLRHGVLSRELVVVPLARLQSIGINQGPVRRRLGLAQARLHTVAGPVSATLSVIDTGDAARMLEIIAAGAAAASASDTTNHWSRTITTPAPIVTPVTGPAAVTVTEVTP
ncbi:PH domain-containing protein [Cryobacterium sp. SO2]|uniref:PH domain-containing protein n=1 Tax=Cryobacterium sp. SO2 TaxID=1897060 RepID=UPI00223E5165|nr:PH domain-containing protein [Cryobacterium sp. SO2]WEO76901.1 PH domain-containing protein [Cryobacterium sp. SO2]